MSSADYFRGMKLPKTNKYNDLEQISITNLTIILDIERFEIRDHRSNKDNGIDVDVELKFLDEEFDGTTVGKFTGIRFNIQLKCSDTIKPNKDGSYSYPINISNLNLLLNTGRPSYYILYIPSENKFYFSLATSLYQSLDEQKRNQDSIKVKFYEELNIIAQDNIYSFVMERGIFAREINLKIPLLEDHRISIDKNLKIFDEEEIKNLIEQGGFYFLNGRESKKILDIVDRLSKNTISSPHFCIIVGIAAFYNGRLLETITYADKLRLSDKTEVHPELIKTMRYFEISAKYQLGFIMKEKYEEIIKDLEESEIVGYYLQIENTWKSFYSDFAEEDKELAYETFINKINTIIDRAKDKDLVRVILNAKCELLHIHGYLLSHHYIVEISELNILKIHLGYNESLQNEAIQRIITIDNQWINEFTALQKEIIELKDEVSLDLCRYYFAKFRYQFYVHISIYKIGDIKLFKESEKEWNNILSLVNTLISNAYRENFQNNLIAYLTLKYEILHYLENYEDAQKVLLEIENINLFVNSVESLRKYEFLKDKGTFHETSQIFFDEKIGNNIKKANRLKEEWENRTLEMQKMDTMELKQNGTGIIYGEPSCTVELFPIGLFYFTKNKIIRFFEILGIENKYLKVQLGNMFNFGISPVINISYEVIDLEGYRDGNLQNVDEFASERIFSRRKKMFDEKFYRLFQGRN